MLFSTAIFIFAFLPFTILVYFLIRESFRNIFLLIVSLFFYAWGEPFYVLLMTISIVANYFFGIIIQRSREESAKGKMILGVVFNLSLLVYYKYFWFIIQNINALFGRELIPYHALALPLGISFYTFHSLSYLIDVYRKKVRAQENILNLGLYISFFPQLIAGPIVRYVDIENQIENRKVNWEGFSVGIERFIIGLAKKVLLANALGETADLIFQLPDNEMTFLCSWLGVVCYTFQIFFDFSGYSDMAIGLARMFGFTFLENFDYPYSARSIKDFWRRWHISLSTWFRDYLYVPLGGNRGTELRTHFNLIIVFFITGLWHGASWNFVIWGLLHGFFLIVERHRFGTWLQRSWPPIQHAYTMIVVMIAWVFFRTENLSEALGYIKVLIGFNQSAGSMIDFIDFLNLKIIIALVLAFELSRPSGIINTSIETPTDIHIARRIFGIFLLIGLFVLSVASIASNTYNPFIYFRF